ncbi:(Fe-S)-binding protein [Tepidibacter formicigenes]|jgi:ArsR family metal-binding transcriptional regulator|uniref:Metal-binding trascriptional regulator, contains putative Fe-S cluster and ArsR family DNA binding domain n=1 Tax=Tepidibacter formicigenes DSM 15518 TaxID=1123349 RepID=A0A1M6P348_9FIRM|nr:(Fe-S)-binding protein [Tepidibacter formicigenes]SHK02344.1 Metal-binding trascriptional regulator, contains putative Fe-S cluster and ArsR family DNA binding domain [Tepidibacter formicigenes DSM 15518]
MYLEDIKITFMQSCIADSKKIRFKAKFSRDISEILPYLNSVLKDAIYNKNALSLTLRKEFRIITLHSNMLAVSKAVNETDAYEIIDFIKKLINNTYENKEKINPLYEMRSKPSVVEIYNHLPKLNCKKCGEATCLAFASKLLSGEQNIKRCLHIYESHNKESLDWMKDFLQVFGC